MKLTVPYKLFPRAGKLTIKCSTLVDVIVTDNWIIKVSPYGMDFAHQSDARIKVDTADTHQLGISGTGTTQFLNIQVSFSRRGNHCFYLRYNTFLQESSAALYFLMSLFLVKHKKVLKFQQMSNGQ